VVSGPGPSAARNPFEALGLDPQAELTDADVHRAWRRIASATHPDRSDGGDLAAYTAASAAYASLRTAWDRGEARADLAETAVIQAVRPVEPGGPAGGAGPAGEAGWAGEAGLAGEVGPVPPGFGPWAAGRLLALAQLPARVRHGRPLRLAVRAVVAALACVAALRVSAGDPAGPGLVTGIITWFGLSGRGDLAPPPGR
jgi:hypothetical protein